MAHLVPPTPTPERFLFYGSFGTGKTNAWFSMLNRTVGRAFVLDTDMSVLDFLDGERYGHLADRIEWVIPEEMEEAIENVERWRKVATPDDFLVIDRVEWLWDEAQAEFSREVFGIEKDEHFMIFRKAAEEAKNSDKKGGSKNPFDGMQDWPTIKARHNRIMGVNFMKWPGHRVIVASEKKMIDGMEDPTTQRDYGGIGFKPAGEKNNGHLVRSVLRFQGNNPNTWRITTVKDREREQLEGKGVKDFAMDYLRGVAGWRMVKE